MRLRLAVGILCGGLLVACTGGPGDSHVSSAVIHHFKGLPSGESVPVDQRDGSSEDLKPWAAWASADTIYVMTWGSGSCPRVPTSVKVEASNHVVISTVEHDFYSGDTACSGDLAVTTSEVRLPSDVNGRSGLLVEIDGTTTRLAVRFK